MQQTPWKDTLDRFNKGSGLFFSISTRNRTSQLLLKLNREFNDFAIENSQRFRVISNLEFSKCKLFWIKVEIFLPRNSNWNNLSSFPLLFPSNYTFFLSSYFTLDREIYKYCWCSMRPCIAVLQVRWAVFCGNWWSSRLVFPLGPFSCVLLGS